MNAVRDQEQAQFPGIFLHGEIILLSEGLLLIGAAAG